MTPRTTPGQRYHIPLFASLMLGAKVPSQLVWTAANLARTNQTIYNHMEMWYLYESCRAELESSLRFAIEDFLAISWYRRMWMDIKSFWRRVQDESK
jgi:hypothetical protein